MTEITRTEFAPLIEYMDEEDFEAFNQQPDDLIETDEDYTFRLHDIDRALNAFRYTLKPKQFRAAQLRAAGTSVANIAHTLDLSIKTVYDYLKLPKVRDVLALTLQRRDLTTLPAKERRANMAWRIAQRTEELKPQTALKALDLIARMEGEYKDTTTEDTQPTIVIKNYTLQQMTKDEAIAINATPAKETGRVIEGDYQRLSVTVDGKEEDKD